MNGVRLLATSAGKVGSLNRVPSFAWGKGGNVSPAGWQVTVCDPIWHVSSRSGWVCCELLCSVYLLPSLFFVVVSYRNTCSKTLLLLAGFSAVFLENLGRQTMRINTACLVLHRQLRLLQ